MNINDYQVGGSLPIDTPSYVVRSADCQLYKALKQGEFCYVLDTRQMGKSSLMVRMMHYLRQEGYCCAAIDMTRIGDERITPEQWYKGLIVELLQGFDLFGKIDFKSWWQEHQGLSPVQILSLFIDRVLLTEFDSQACCDRSGIVIFFDEIDSVLSLDFSVNDFFALIRFCYNQRSLNAKYNRLTIVLLGVATPSNLIDDYRRTPFNIGRAIQLSGFSWHEARPLLAGLTKTVRNPKAVLQEILRWTSGQPFLTQKLCQLVSSFPPQADTKDEVEWIERLIQTRAIDNWQTQDEPEHLKTIRDRLLCNEQKISSLLTLYQQILQQGFIITDNSVEQQELLLSGLIIREGDKLKVRNLIYQRVFNLTWIETQLFQLRPYSESLYAWQKSGCSDTSRLLRGKALEDAIEWSLDKNLSNLDRHFLASSEKLDRKEIQQAFKAERAKEIEIRLQEKQRTAKLQRYFLVTLSLAFVAVLGFGLFARKQYRQANLNEIKALINYSQALFASDKRFEALITSIEIEQKWKQLNYLDVNIEKQIELVLRQAVYRMDEYNRLSDHDRTIFGVDIYPDSQQIVTASADTTLKLWQANGTLSKTFEGHEAVVWDAVFSPDGKTIASASRDRTIGIWNRDSGFGQTFGGHQDEVVGIAFSPDGKTIASASRDRTIKLWQPDGKLIDTLESHSAAVWKAAFSPDGQTIATVGEDKTLKLWQLNDRGRFELAQTITGHAAEIRNVAFSPDGKIIATASHDRTIKLWQSNTGKLLRTLKHNASVVGIAFSADGRQIISGSWDNTIKIWSIRGDLFKNINIGEKRIWDLALGLDNKTVAVASEQIDLSLVALDNPLLKVLRGHSEPVIDVAFSPDGKTIVSASDDRQIKFWDNNGSLLTSFTSEQDSVLGIAWSPDGNELVSGHWNGALNFLRVRDLQGDRPTVSVSQTIKAHLVGLWRITFSRNGKLIATASEDLTAKLWDRQGNLISTFKGHRDTIRGIAISPDSKIIATASHDETIKLWNRQGDLLASLKNAGEGVSAVDFSPDGTTFATGSYDGILHLWQIEQKQGETKINLLHTLVNHQQEIRQVAFSPDSQLIATASADTTIDIWHRNGKLLETLYGHDEEVWSVAFSPDGKQIVSSSEDRTVIIWDLEKMLELDLSAAACIQIKDYLQTNSKIGYGKSHLCDR